MRPATDHPENLAPDVAPGGAEWRVWDDQRLLGHDGMDAAHREFYDVTFAMLVCTQANAMATLQAFEAHAHSHFGEEERWMQSTGFPSHECHTDEHHKVLASVREVRDALDGGRADHHLVQRLADNLLAWFPGHSDYMDSALATWLSNRRFGAQPIVLKRRAMA
jgi:hemerythrin